MGSVERVYNEIQRVQRIQRGRCRYVDDIEGIEGVEGIPKVIRKEVTMVFLCGNVDLQGGDRLLCVLLVAFLYSSR